MIKICLCLLMWASSWHALSGELSVQPESIFAIVTHKAGLLSSLGHNHLVFAGQYEANLTMEDNDPTSIKLKFSTPVAELKIDDPKANETWYPHLEAAGILDEAFSDVSEKNRKKMTKSMLSKKQLNVNKFPKIEASIDAVREKSDTVGKLETTHVLTLKLVIRDVSRTISVPAAITIDNGTLSIRAVAEMKFTDFGIEPYSAMLGSVANDDQIHIFVDLVAR